MSQRFVSQRNNSNTANATAGFCAAAASFCAQTGGAFCFAHVLDVVRCAASIFVIITVASLLGLAGIAVSICLLVLVCLLKVGLQHNRLEIGNLAT